MATTKGAIPQVNLKDRIAALQQQRNATSTHPEMKRAGDQPRLTGSLRDKIANFEKQGAVPVPRGSFGLGAPPVDDGSSRRRGELIGNRVPGLSKPVAPVSANPLRALSPEPMVPRRRLASMTDSRVTPPILSVDSNSLDTLAESLPELPRRPSMVAHASRRSVSDILPRTPTIPSVSDTLPEEELLPSAPVVSDLTESANAVDTSVNVPQSFPSSVLEEPILPSSDNTSLQERRETTPLLDVADASPSGYFGTDVGQISAAEHPSEVLSNGLGNHDAVTNSISETTLDAGLSGLQVVASSEAALASTVEQEDQHVETAPTKSDVLSDSDPSDLSPAIDIQQADTGTATLAVNDVVCPVVAESVEKVEPISVQPASKDASAPFSPAQPAQPLTLPQNAYLADVTDYSIALDTSDAVIVTEPARKVSPIITRAVLVPAPQVVSQDASMSPSSVASTSASPRPVTSPVSPSVSFVEPSLTPKANQGTFHAVVHRKVTERSKEVSHAEPTSKPAPIPRLQVSVAEPLQSPGFDDLADLLVNASILEQQLSGLGSPRKLPAVKTQSARSVAAEPNPSLDRITPTVEISAPEQPSSIEDVSESTDDQSSSQYESPQEFPAETLPELRTPPKGQYRSRVVSEAPSPVTSFQEHRRSRLLSDTPPPVPPKSPRQRLSTLLVRKSSKLTMPGAYPRNSVCSEMSEDDSLLVTTPPSPRFDSYGAVSDASSVRSSTRSWKMPKTSLSRATSFADKIWSKRNNRNTVVIATPGKQHLRVSTDGTSELYKLNGGLADDDDNPSAEDITRHRPSAPTLPKLNLTPNTNMNDPSPRDGRPLSWVSVSSTGSPGLDSTLFDAFPSVPTSIPSLPPLPGSQSHFTSEHLDSPGTAFRSSTLPTRSSSHQKQRSAMV